MADDTSKWPLLLEVWSLTPPMSGGTPSNLPGSLFHTTFRITPYRSPGPPPPNQFPIVSVQTIRSPASPGDIPIEIQLGREDASRFAVTAWNVVAFRFSSASGWPKLVDLASTALPLRADVSDADQRFGPFADDKPDSHTTDPEQYVVNASNRLQLITACTASFVRLISNEPTLDGTKQARWWLTYNFSFRTPIMGDDSGVLVPSRGGLLDNRLLEAVYGGASSLSASNLFPQRQDIGEVRTGGMTRRPYFAGSLMRPAGNGTFDPLQNVLQGVAINAPAYATLYGLDLANEDDNNGKRNSPPALDGPARLSQSVALADGLWWTKNRIQDSSGSDTGDNLGDYIDNPHELTFGLGNIQSLLDGTLKSGDIVKMPSSNPPLPTQPVLTALTSTSPCDSIQSDAFIPDLPILSLFGLQTVATGAPPTAKVFDPANPSPPYHYLHTRLVPAGSTGSLAFEWRRWVGLGNPGAADTDAPIPVLLRVRQKPFDPTAPATSAYTLSVEGLTDSHALMIWTSLAARRSRDAAVRATGDQVPNLMPDIIGDGASDPGQWVLELDCGETFTAPVEIGASQCQPPLPEGFVRAGRLYKAAVAPATQAAGAPWGWYGSTPPDQAIAESSRAGKAAPSPPGARATAAQLVFPGVGDHLGEPLSVRATTVYFVTGAVDAANRPPKIQFEINDGLASFAAHSVIISAAPAPAGASIDQIVAVGALDLAINPDQALTDETTITIRIDPNPAAASVSTSDEFGLAVREVRAGSVDDLSRPLCLQPLIWANGPIGVFLGLKFDDQVSRTTGRRQVDMTLVKQDHSNPPGGAGGPPAPPDLAATVRVVSLDPQPMSVFAATSTVATAGQADQDVVATWDSVEQVWRLPTTSGATATLQAPPQGLGEAWERRSADATSPSAYLPLDQLPEGARAPSLPTPPATITIQTEGRARNPVAWWNLQRLLADLSTDLPGSQLTGITSLETLYGLEAFSTPTTGLRLAEQTAWRGAPCDVPGDGETAPDPDSRLGRWALARDALTGRLGVFEARNPDDVLAQVVIPNVRFKLRQTGRYATPQTATTPPSGPYVLPTNDLIDEQLKEKWFLPNENDGVLGGALAGFEDGGLIQDLLRNADGGIGSIDGVQLSALGAWTRPRAAFNNGLTQISADIEMGRTHEARFERLGRIGILRTKAKHVIVYRRAFLPSLQFRADQDQHFGRPIVRKVEEYIEILQPYRAFPDAAGGAQKHSGPITGSRFRSIRIPVHGSWRHPILADGTETGYAIPLWREGADPVVYPRPHIELLTAAHPDADELEPAGQRVVNVADLQFYTLFDHGTFKADADTDKWPNQVNIDFADRAVDSPLSAVNPDRAPKHKTDFQGASGPAEKLAPAIAVAGGLEPFTLRLEPGRPANLTFGRSAKAMVANLESVTLMRAKTAPKAPPTAPPTARMSALTIGDRIEAAREAARAELASVLAQASQTPAGPVPPELNQAAQALVDGSLASLKSAFAAATALPTSFPKALDPTALTDPGCGWAGDHIAGVKAAANSVTKQLAAWRADLDAAKQNWARYGAQAMSDLDDAQGLLAALSTPSQAATLLVSQSISNVSSRLDAYQTQVDAQLDGGAGRIADLLDQAARAITTGQAAALSAVQKAIPTLIQTPLTLNAVSAAAAALRTVALTLGNAASVISTTGGRADTTLQAAATELSRVSVTLAPTLLGCTAPLRANVVEATGRLNDGVDNLNALAGGIEQAQQAVQTANAATMATALQGLDRALRDAAAMLAAGANPQLEAAKNALGLAKTAVAKALSDLDSAFVAGGKAASTAIGALPPPVDGTLSDDVVAIRASISVLRSGASAAVGPGVAAISDLQTKLATLQTQLDSGSSLDAIQNVACNYLTDAGSALAGQVKSWLGDASVQIKPLTDAINGNVSAVTAVLQDMVQPVEAATAQYAGMVRTFADNQTDAAAALVDDGVLRLLRAAGAPPEVEGLVFNRDRLAYYYDDVQKIVTTPATALLEQTGDQLRGVGVVMPTLGIDDTLLPPLAASFEASAAEALGDLAANLDLNVDQILTDLAGFKDLLSGLDMSNALGDAVKITHDVDLHTRSAFVQADIDYSPADHPLFEFAAFALTVQDAHLTGKIHYDRAIAGAETKHVNAQLAATWVLQLGGAPLISIKDATAIYNDQSGLKFDIRPQNVQFNGALEALSNVLAAYDGVDSPTKIEMVIEDGLPVGVRSSYDLPPTIMGFGAFTIMNATLGVALELAQRSEFEISVSAYMGRKDSPFSMVIVWLGGGGYFEASAIYLPRTNAIDLAVDVSLGATAGIGFSFGPLEGFVEVYFGIEATYITHSGAGQLLIAGLIVIDGAVTAWGIVTVTLGVQLSLTYGGGNHAIGRGFVDVEVQISRFFHLGFSSQMTRTI
jgi:hypothetical protein